MDVYDNYNLTVSAFNTENKEIGVNAVMFMMLDAIFNDACFIPSFPTVGFGLDKLKHTLVSDTSKITAFKQNVEKFALTLFPELRFKLDMSLQKNEKTGEIMTNLVLTEETLGLKVVAETKDLSKIVYSVNVKNYNN